MSVRILQGDCRDVLKTLPDESVHCVVTSPPYFGLRDYGMAGQIGLEKSPEAFVRELVSVFGEVRRVLRSDGTLWLNLGDSYANDGKWGGSTGGKHAAGLHGEPVGRGKRETGLKPKDLIGIPWRVALALQAAGWWLRQDIIWAKPNPMPESVRDRCTKAHEYVFLLAKAGQYYFDQDAIAEPSKYAPGCGWESVEQGHYSETPRASHDYKEPQQSFRSIKETRNRRSVWTIPTKAFNEAHFATFPPDLIESCILAGCPAGGTVLDPFGGACTSGLVADRLQRDAIIIELNPKYVEMGRKRITNDGPLFSEVT